MDNSGNDSVAILPPNSVSGVMNNGRVKQGLDPKTVTLNQLNMAANFLFAAIDGQRTIVPEFSATAEDGTVRSLRSPASQVVITDDRHSSYKVHVRMIPTRNVIAHNQFDSGYNYMAAGYFLGRLHKDVSSLGIFTDGMTDPKTTGVTVGFRSHAQLARALNKLAQEIGEVSHLFNLDLREPAINVLTQIGQTDFKAR
jgi:hypothetical protein